METQILKLEAPFDYIYCNGEVGRHIATYIVGESRIGEDGKYTLETHSHPIVQYANSPKGVVWNRAELTDCEVLCNDDDKRIDPETFAGMCFYLPDRTSDNTKHMAESLKLKLNQNGIDFRGYDDGSPFEVEVEVNKSNEGYYAMSMVPDLLLDFYIIEPTLEELAKRLTEEREYQEAFFDHVVKIEYVPGSVMAEGFVESL